MNEEVIRLLKQYTGHEEVRLTSRGNTAIFAALYIARKVNPRKGVLIPDQGGWLTYKKYPKMLGLEVKDVKTHYGLIDLKDLNSKLEDASALLYANPAGYFAEQDIAGIYKACKGRALVIMDVSGCLGDKSLCDGRYADLIVGSFGRWKPVNLGYGGFVSAKDKEHFVKAKEIFNTVTFEEKYYPILVRKLEEVRERLKKFYKECEKMKKELKSFDVIHRKRKGIVVVVKYSSEDEKSCIIDYCEKNKYQYTLCPRYIRVEEKAVSIEAKRL
jgi:histidinol-phosphate/aromatic aminotransferase/cobyric acid decarboxylase-like protein